MMEGREGGASVGREGNGGIGKEKREGWDYGSRKPERRGKERRCMDEGGDGSGR